MSKLNKKTWIIIAASAVALALAITAILLAVGLSGNKNVTITFNTMGGDPIASIEVEKGTDVRSLELPEAQKVGMVFSAWYTDESITTQYYDTDGIINSDITLYAGYSEYEESKSFVNIYDVGETTLDIAPDESIVLLSPVELTTDNFYEYITLTNKLEVSGGGAPQLSVTKGDRENMYNVSPVGKWPDGGMFELEASDGIKFVLTSDDGVVNNDGAEVAASKATLLIDITEEYKSISESNIIVKVEAADYESFDADKLVIKASAVSKYSPVEGMILKVIQGDGSHQYIKAGKCQTDQAGNVTIAVETALPGEVFSEFEFAGKDDESFLSDRFDEIDKQEVLSSIVNNPNFVILEDLATLSAVDYVNERGIADVGGVVLLSGTTMGDVSGAVPLAYVGNFDLIWEVTSGPEVLQLEDEYKLMRTGVSFDIIFDDDTYARITLELQTGSCYGLLTRGSSKKMLPILDIWLNARLKADYVTVFKFNIIMHDGDKVYDASEEMNNFGKKDADSLVAEYKELIKLDTDKLKILDEDIFTLTFNILEIVVLRVPFGLEVEIDLNGSFSTELINRVAHFYGVNGSVRDGFDFWDAHCWQMEYENTAYYGKFDISIGVRGGVTIGLAGFDTLGRFGLKAEIGVYYQFLGYGYTSSSYESWNTGLGNSGNNDLDPDAEIKKDNKSSTYTSETRGAMYNELGLYLQFGMYVESEIFKLKGELESPQIRIKLMEQGTLYDVKGTNTPLLPIGFGASSKAAAETPLVINEYGVPLALSPYLEIDYLNLKTGEVITAQMDVSDFRVRSSSVIYYDSGTGMIMPRTSASKNARIDGSIVLRYTDDALYYIDGYQTKLVRKNGDSEKIEYLGAYTELEIPITYLPMSISDNADRLDDVLTVDFTLGGKSVKSLDVKYGSSIYMTLRDKNVYLHDYVMSGDQELLSDPDISMIYVPDAMYYTPITENVQIEIEVECYGVPISVKWREGADGNIYHSTIQGYMVWCKNKLYDELSEMAADPHENLKFVGWRDATTGEMIPEDRIVKRSDGRTLTVEAVYEGDPITITVNIEALNDGMYSFAGTTYTYTVNAGESILTKLTADVGHSFRIADWAMYVTEFEKYAETFAASFYSDQTINISWTEMEAKYKVTFDPSGGSFSGSPNANLVNGAYELNCSEGFMFTREFQEIIKPQKSDDIASYYFVGWYYIKENGEKAFGIKPAYENRTYYAEWLADEKYFTITLNAEGTADGKTMTGTFVTGKTTHVYTLKYSEIQALAESIKNGYFDPILIPAAGEYVFDKWVFTSESNGNHIFNATYKKGMISVTVLSRGQCGSEMLDGTFPSGAVTSFTLTSAEWADMKARIEAGDYSDLPVITPVSQDGIFDYWRVSKISEIEYGISPVYKENKEITITISAIGDCNGTAVRGTLSGSGTIVLRQREADAFIEKVYSADYSEMPTVTPESDEFTFASWKVSYPSSTEYLITPIYARGAFATVTIDLGRGSDSSSQSGSRTLTLEITGETFAFSISDHLEPTPLFSVNGYNENGRFTDYACFEDEHYYYVFSGWNTSDGKTSWSLKHGDSITLTAEYSKLPKAYCIELTVDINSAEKEIFTENGRPTNYGSVSVWGAYGESWSKFGLPTAIKQTMFDSDYTYEFTKWVSVDTGDELSATVTGGGRYKAVFNKVAKPEAPNSVTVTFDAGENGYFLSTGSRYKAVEFAIGTLYDDIVNTLEKPIHNNAIYEFHDWIDWWYGQKLDESMSVMCAYWNTSRGCLEGEEDLIQVFFDAGEGAYFEANYNAVGLLVYPELDPRYFVHGWEEGTLFYSGADPADSGYTAGYTYEISYFEHFVIVKDGKRYTAKWNLPEQLIYTWNIDKTVITYTELIPYGE